MTRWLVGSSLRLRAFVVAAGLAIVALGSLHLRDAPVDVLPEFTPPYVEIQTEALGLSAEEVEELITVPLEADLLNGVEGVDVIRSSSVPGLSSIVLVFDRGADLYRSRALVQERLTQAHALPNVSKPPTMLQPLSSSSRVLMIGLSSKELSPIQRSVIARWTVRPRLMGVDGVANVAIWGMRDQQLQVQVDPEHLRDEHVTLKQVISTAGNAQVVSPVTYLEASTPGTGGFIETRQQRLQVRNVFDNIASPEDLGRVPVDGTGGRKRLSDVASVVQDHQPLIGDAIVDDGEGLMLVVEKLPGASTLDVTRGVDAALDKLRPGLSGLKTDTSVFRPASVIETATDNLRTALLLAGALLALALAAVLLRWRTVLVCLVAIPVSLVTAALVLEALGETFNAISFAGLAIALAVVVDDAVMGVENVMRRRAGTGDKRPISRVVLGATQEVRSPLAYATVIALLAIVPVAAMSGRPGAFFAPLVLAYALAVAAAMLVALTVTPALSMLLLERGAPTAGESPLMTRIGARYDALLHRALPRPRTVLVAAGGCAIVGLAALPLLGTSLIPSFKDRDLLVRLDAPPGTSSPRMTQIATDLSAGLRGLDGVENVGAHVGRAVTGDQIADVNSGELWVTVDRDADYDKTMASIRAAVDGVRGADGDVVTYSAQKIRDVGALDEGANPATGDGLDVLTGTDEPLVVRLYGQDQAVLRREADGVRRMLAGVDGVVDPRVEAPGLQPSLQVEVDVEKGRRYGIKPGDVHRAEAALLQGIQVGSVFRSQKVFDVIVRGVPATRRDVAGIRGLLIDRPGGGHVRLGEVADVRVARTPAVIQRDAVSRRLDIVAGVSGRGLGAVVDDVEAQLAGRPLPLEYHAEVLRRTTGEEIGSGRVLGVALACLLAILLVFQAAFRSWPLAVIAFLSLPLALVGGVVAALIGGGELSLGSLAGLLAVFALAARGGLVLLRHLQHLERGDGGVTAPESVLRGARDRLAPTLATAAALAAAAIPIVVMGPGPGLEILQPMAVTLLGGLVTTTLVVLLVLPVLYLRFGAGRPAEIPPEEEELLYRWGAEPEPAVGGGASVARGPAV